MNATITYVVSWRHDGAACSTSHQTQVRALLELQRLEAFGLRPTLHVREA
jgi:hypothetical protein